MDLSYFPFDYQLCPFNMESFAYRSNQLDLQWDLDNPVQFHTQMELGEFLFDSVTLKKECEREYTTGTFSCLEGELLMTRALGYYIMQGRVLVK